MGNHPHLCKSQPHAPGIRFLGGAELFAFNYGEGFMSSSDLLTRRPQSASKVKKHSEEVRLASVAPDEL